MNTLKHNYQVASSIFSTGLRGGVGIQTQAHRSKPPLLLELYEFEACPYCRLVREVLTELDLDALIQPCPKGGTRFRPTVRAHGGLEQFPWFHDPNTGTRLYESADIISYLFNTYSDEGVPLRWQLRQMQELGSTLSGLPRGNAGRQMRPSLEPAQPLELYSFEGSPYARLVRERLCELELPYILRSCGRTRLADWLPPVLRQMMAPQDTPDTLNRKTLQQRAGSVSIPYLVDPNTGTEMAESSAILDYLEATYATG